MTIANTNTEYRDLPLSVLTESRTNPRRFFEDSALKELADFVPGHKIGQLFKRGILEDAAGVGGGLGEDGEGNVAVFVGGVRVHRCSP